MLTEPLVALGICVAVLAEGTPGVRMPPNLEPTPPAGALPVRTPATPPTDADAESPSVSVPREACAPVTARRLGSMLLRNEAGDVVAKVQDLVIDPCNGRVAYAAISFGQPAGMGDVLYVVPWDRIETLPGSHELRLTISPELVKRGPRFAISSWPNFADREYRAAVERYYAEPGASPRVIRSRPIVR